MLRSNPPPPTKKKDKIKSDANRYISDCKWRYHDYSSRRHAPFPRGRGNAFHRLNSPPIGRFSGFSHSNGPWLAAAGRSPKKRLLLALCQLSSRTRPVLGIGDRLLLSRITESANRVRRQKISNERTSGCRAVDQSVDFITYIIIRGVKIPLYAIYIGNGMVITNMNQSL